MSACPECAIASKRFHCIYVATCEECMARSIAESKEYWDSLVAGTVLPAYKAALQNVFRADWTAGHAKVKAWHETLARVKP